MLKIDFVLPWVDSSSPSWNAERDKVWKQSHPEEWRENADEGTLRYFFRGIEKFAPWVNKIFFITCGQKPEWLNENNPKLALIDHKDYIPEEYLPTFNSNVIELNLFRIPELSEHFVLFNDDVFLTRPVNPDFFFQNDVPCLPCDLSICDYYGVNYWSYACFNDYCVLNDHFDLYKAIGDNRTKWFSLRDLGWKVSLKNWICYKINRTMFIRGYEHLSNSHLKSTFQKIWEACPDVLEATSRNQFRSWDQINQWLICAWNQASGSFYPSKPYSHGSHFNVSTRDLEYVCKLIREQSISQICINDTADNDDPEMVFQKIKMAFESILPEKSSFEK